MTTITLRSAWPTLKDLKKFAFACTAPIALYYLGRGLQDLIPTIGVLDMGIWQLVALSILSFIGLSSLSWWLLKRAWSRLGLPAIEKMVLQFKELTLWHQFIVYWASFALLLLASVMSLVAVI